jgi:hypothetical protein
MRHHQEVHQVHLTCPDDRQVNPQLGETPIDGTRLHEICRQQRLPLV